MAQDVFGIVGGVVAGAYKVERVVAEGGFAVVYRAYHSGFRAPVALKCLKVQAQLSGSHQQRFLEQFQREAELLFRLSASLPQVVRPLHVDALRTPRGEFVPFLALEWLEGETLDAVITRRRERREPPFQLPELIELLTPVARALERAHNFAGPEGAVSIVHRDLKPENIFIAEVAGERVVKILDFGIAKAKSVASQVAGRASQLGGGIASFTPAYGAPEQWSPRRFGQTGPWTDVWGFALTLVEALAGHPIIEGDHAAMMGHALDPVRRPTPRTEGVRVSDAVERVFARALALDPRERHAHAGVFWEDLLAARAAPELRLSPKNEEARIASRSEPTPASGLPALELDFVPVSSAPQTKGASSVASRPPQSAERHGELEFEGDEAFSLSLEDRPSIRPSVPYGGGQLAQPSSGPAGAPPTRTALGPAPRSLPAPRPRMSSTGPAPKKARPSPQCRCRAASCRASRSSPAALR